MDSWGLSFAKLPLKRFYKYILKRLIGGFLKHDIDLEQLDVQLYRGIVQLKSLELDARQLNLAAMGLASAGPLLHFVGGVIGCIKMDIPWRHLLRDHCKVYISGFSLELAKGLPEEFSPAAISGLGPNESQHPCAESTGATSAPDRPGGGRYSEEGIETLSRLVKQVLSRMEVCFHDTSLSVSAPPARSKLWARLASMVVFSERPTNGVESRSVRVMGFVLALAPCAASSGSGEPAGSSREEMVLASTDAPPSGVPTPGVVHIRKREHTLTSGEAGSSGALAEGPAVGVHLDVEVFLPALRFALGPPSWRALAECLDSLREAPPLATANSPEAVPMEMSQTLPLNRGAHPSMVQSLVESSLPGNPSPAGFWYELYNLFEADSQLEDAAGHADPREEQPETTDEDAHEPAEEMARHGGALQGGQAIGATIVGCSVRISVMRIAALVLLGDGVSRQEDPALPGSGVDEEMVPQPADVQLLPGPAAHLGTSQAQLCIEKWELTLTQQGCSATPTPAITSVVRTLAIHLHKRSSANGHAVDPAAMQANGRRRAPVPSSGSGAPPSAMRRETLGPPAAAAAASSITGPGARAAAIVPGRLGRGESSRGPEEYIIHSNRGMDFIRGTDMEIDPALFCSARSQPAVERSGSRTPSVASYECPTEESIGDHGSEDSFMRSRASSLHSFGDPDEPGMASAFDGDMAMASRMSGADAELGDADRSCRSASEADLDLETLFFDRSRSAQDALLGQRHVSADMGTGMRDDGGSGSGDVQPDSFGWSCLAPPFKSKRIAYLVPISGPDASPWDVRANDNSETESREPTLSLPAAGHAMWQSLRLPSGCQSASPSTIGNQILFESTGLSAGTSSPSVQPMRIECQPIVLSLCAESLFLLATGAAWLRGPEKSPAALPPTASRPRASMATVATDSGDAHNFVQTYALVSIAPMIRVELILTGAQQDHCRMVGDIVAPRIFSQPTGKRPPADLAGQLRGQSPGGGLFEELMHVELGDIGVFFTYKVESSSAGATAGTAYTGSGSRVDTELAENRSGATVAPVRCFRMLSTDPRENADGGKAVSTICLFQRTGANSCAPRNPGLPRFSEEPQNMATPGDSPSSALSEWTKISVPQLSAAEGRPSRSSAMLQDLRHASQRFLRPGQSRSSASVPASARHRDRYESEVPGQRDRSLDSVSAQAGSLFGGVAAGSSGSSRHARAASVDAAGGAKGDGQSGGVSLEGNVEIELKIPGIVQLQSDALSFLLLQEAFSSFVGHFSGLAVKSAATTPTAAPTTSNSAGSRALPARRDCAVAATAGFTLAIDCLSFKLLEGGESPEESGTGRPTSERGEEETLQFQLSPIWCRIVQLPRSSVKVCGLGLDLRLEGLHRGKEVPEQFIRPWYKPLFHNRRSAPSSFVRGSTDLDAASPSAASSYGWEVRQAQKRSTMIDPVFRKAEENCWQDTHSVFFQLEQRRLGATARDQTNMCLKLNRIVFNAHPHMQRIYQRLISFFNPPVISKPPSTAATQAFTVYQVAVLDCLIDAPSEAYAHTWPITSPNGIHVPTPPPLSRGRDLDKWRVVLHVDGLELSCGTLHGFEAQGLKVCAGECNVFLVDHPSHLSGKLDLVSSSSQPGTFLVDRGFAHILDLSGVTVVWRSQSPAAVPASAGVASGSGTSQGPATMQNSTAWQSLTVSVGSIAGHLCADSVKCLLCIGSELVEAPPASASPATVGARPKQRPAAAERTTPNSAPRGAGMANWPPDGPEASGMSADGVEFQSEAADGPVAVAGVSILNNIDMFAFEGGQEAPAAAAAAPESTRFEIAEEAPPSVAADVAGRAATPGAPHLLPSSPQSAEALGQAPFKTFMIDDYIRAQERKQNATSVVVHASLGGEELLEPSQEPSAAHRSPPISRALESSMSDAASFHFPEPGADDDEEMRQSDVESHSEGAAETATASQPDEETPEDGVEEDLLPASSALEEEEEEAEEAEDPEDAPPLSDSEAQAAVRAADVPTGGWASVVPEWRRLSWMQRWEAAQKYQRKLAAPRAPPQSSAVAICLFDPEAVREGELRELCAQERTARLEVEQLFNRRSDDVEEDWPFGEPPSLTTSRNEEATAPVPCQSPQEVRASVPGNRAEAPTQAAVPAAASVVAPRPAIPQIPADQRKVLHQDGSAAVWFINPEDLQVVHDHFVRWTESQDDEKLHPPAQAPPIKVVVTFQCDRAHLSLHGGVDFVDEPHLRCSDSSTAAGLEDSSPAARQSGRKQNVHLSLRLERSVVKLMLFDVAQTAGGPQLAPDVNGNVVLRRLVACAKDFSIDDHIPGSVFSHLLAYFEDELTRPRPNYADMFYLRVDEVAPVAVHAAGTAVELPEIPEYQLDVRLLPLRLTIDQDVVDFLMEFVQLCTLPTYEEEEPLELALATSAQIRATAVSSSPSEDNDRGDLLFSTSAGAAASPHTGDSSSSPTAISEEVAEEICEEGLVAEEDALLTTEAAVTQPSAVGVDLRRSHPESQVAIGFGSMDPGENIAGASVHEEPNGTTSMSGSPRTARALFFQQFSVGALLLSVDYRAKRLDVEALRRGELWELVNLLPLLEGLQIAFRSVKVSGVEGLSQVGEQVVSAWSADLNRTQILRSYLTGVTPIRSFANIGGGFAELVLEPLRQYRTGGGKQRISRTLLRGLVSFLRHVTVESIDLSERILVGTQSALEFVHTALSDPATDPASSSGRGRRAARSSPPRCVGGSSDGAGTDLALNWTSVERGAADFLQPGDAAEGLQQAVTNVTRGMRRAGQAVVVRPLHEFQRGASREQVLRTVVSGIPMCVLRPMIGISAAATTALRGVRNSVDPHHRREIVRKYKEPQ